jgi:iron complex outermembrane recepter protein
MKPNLTPVFPLLPLIGFALAPLMLRAQEPTPLVSTSSTLDETVVRSDTPTPATVSETGYRSEIQSAAGFLQQSILDTPFQVTVLPSELIRDQQARSLTEIARNDPSVQAGDNSPGFYDRIAVRGFYIFNAHRDGLVINDQAQMPLENKAAVEIVKGLAALRYGFISPGGVVNYVLKRPTDDPLARVNVYGSSFGTHGIHGDFGGRVGPDGEFGYRINALSEEEHTYVDEVRGPRRMVSGFFDWKPVDELLVEVEFEHQYRELPQQAGLYNGIFAPGVDELKMVNRFNPETFLGSIWGVYPTWTTFFSGRIRYDLNDDWAARVAVSRQDLTRDQTGVSPAFGSIEANGDYIVEQYYYPNQERDVTVVEAAIEGEFETGPLAHKLAAGYIFEEQISTAPDGFYGPIGTSNIFKPVAIPNPHSTSSASYAYAKNRTHSVFVVDSVEITEQLEVFGGLRYIDPQFDSFDGPGIRSARYEESVVTPSAGVVMKPTESLSFYTSYAEGLEQGGTAPVTAANALRVLPPLASEQYEIGVKADLFAGATLSAAAFKIDKGLEYLNASNVYVQDGRQIHQGVETVLSGEVTDRLRVVTGVAWLDATVEESGDPLLNGKRPQGVAEWQSNLYLDYDLSPLIQGLSINTGLYFSGDRPVSSDNALEVDGYVRWDLGLRYVTDLGGVPATLRVNLFNVADNRYIENAFWGGYGFGAPRSVAFGVEFEF